MPSSTSAPFSAGAFPKPPLASIRFSMSSHLDLSAIPAVSPLPAYDVLFAAEGYEGDCFLFARFEADAGAGGDV